MRCVSGAQFDCGTPNHRPGLGFNGASDIHTPLKLLNLESLDASPQDAYCDYKAYTSRKPTYINLLLVGD